jgi:hypothetical protein
MMNREARSPACHLLLLNINKQRKQTRQDTKEVYQHGINDSL